MAVVNIVMDTRKSAVGALLPQDIELNILSIQLFYYACAALTEENGHAHFSDIGASVVVDRIEFTNPFDIWVFLKTIPAGVAKEILNRTLYYKSECARRDAEADSARQMAVSEKLNNLRKANEIRDELLASGGDPEEATKLLGKILYEQDAVMTVHDGGERRQTPKRLPFR